MLEIQVILQEIPKRKMLEPEVLPKSQSWKACAVHSSIPSA